MTLDRYFKLSSYTLFAASFLMLAATRQLDWPTIILFASVLVIGWLVDDSRIRWRIPKRLVTGLMLGYFPFVVVDYALLGSASVLALIHFIFFASSFKLLQPKQNRDWLWLYTVSFFEVLLAAGMMIDTTFFVLLIIFLLAGISTMMSFEIRRAQAVMENAPEIEFWKETREARRRLGQPRVGNLGYFSASALALILLLAAPLFLVMPRVSGGFFGGRLLRSAALSGFSDSVRLGEVAQVKLNPRVVMRVRVEQPAEQYRAALRWRGVTFDFYDGRSWTELRTRRKPVSANSVGEYRLNDPADANFITKQTVYLEPLDIGTIFAAPEPFVVRDIPLLARDDGAGLWTRSHPFNHIIYTVFSDTREVRDAELRTDTSRLYWSDISRRYLQLPDDRDRRIDELAAEVTRGAATPLDIARRIENHLRTSYNYTLDLRRTNDGDPVADFLFNVRAGHCEYFATAMALMLRMRGVPSRLVNGFQMGEYSDVADVYTVRQSDAHSWVEAYFPKYGWIAFDPTPAAGLNVYDDGLMARLRHYGEAVEMFWQEHVVGFGESDQSAISFRVQQWLASYQTETSRWTDWKTQLVRWIEEWRRENIEAFAGMSLSEALRRIALHPWALAFYAFVGLIGAALIWQRRRQSWRYRLQHDAAGSAIAFYQEMLTSLERTGYQRTPDQTPQEFADALGLPSVREVTRCYQQVRFGGRRLTEIEIEQVSSALQELKKRKTKTAFKIESLASTKRGKM